MDFISSGVVAQTELHVLKLWTLTDRQTLDRLFSGEPQVWFWPLSRVVKHSELKEPTSLLNIDSTNPITTLLHFKHSIGTQTQTAVLKSSYIRQFYIYRPQALENLEDNLESKVRKFHSKIGYSWENPGPQKRIALETPYHDRHTGKSRARTEAKYTHFLVI